MMLRWSGMPTGRLVWNPRHQPFQVVSSDRCTTPGRMIRLFACCSMTWAPTGDAAGDKDGRVLGDRDAHGEVVMPQGKSTLGKMFFSAA